MAETFLIPTLDCCNGARAKIWIAMLCFSTRQFGAFVFDQITSPEIINVLTDKRKACNRPNNEPLLLDSLVQIKL